MGIDLTDDQRALAAAVHDWAAALGTTALTKASEHQGAGCFHQAWKGLAELGVLGLALPDEAGGGEGSAVDLAVAVEACAQAMVPGPVLPTLAAGLLLAPHVDTALLAGLADGSTSVAVGLDPGTLTIEGGRVSGEAAPVWGAGLTTHLLLPVDDGLWLVPASSVTVETGPVVDLATRIGAVRVEDVPRDAGIVVPASPQRLRTVAAMLAAAEAAGTARWCLDAAVDHARVREQFGRPIGSFQAVKHLCASMLERTEAAVAVAWDAAAAYDEGDADQLQLAVAVAAPVALDAAVTVAQDAIQVLGGIGFTWEHDAHLHLRRAMTNRTMLGGTDAWRARLAFLALDGRRRSSHVDLTNAGESTRQEVRALVAEVAALPQPSRRRALVERGLLVPHWPRPYGREASAVEQLVIDEELRAADVERPSLGIGAWAAPTILQHGTDEQRERFVGPTLLGEITWCQLFSEPSAGSDLAALRTRASRTPGGWLLTGQKVWTSLAAEADWGICLARTNPDAPKHRGISYFLVDMSTPGLDIRPLRELTGDALFNEVFLDEVFVPHDCLVGEVDGGWPLARTTLANERVAIGDSSFGVSVERALAAVAAGDVDPALRLRLGEAVAASGAVQALGRRSTRRSLAGAGPGAESSVLKLLGVQQRQESAELVLDVLGDDVLLGRGEGPAAVHEALVTRCLSIAGGTTQVLRNVAAERLLGLPRD